MNIPVRIQKPSSSVLATVIILSLSGVLFLTYLEKLNGQSAALYLQNKNYGVQTALHDLYPTPHADVVMLGNSLTYNVNWNELMGRTSIVNRGIASDITEGYLHRLDAVVKLKPRLCFIEGGINDIYAGVPVDLIYANYKRIVEELKRNAIVPIIQSTLYVSPRWHDYQTNNRSVKRLNAHLRQYAATNGIEFIDLNKALGADDVLDDSLTYDGVHLNAQGYALWAPKVKLVLVAHGL